MHETYSFGEWLKRQRKINGLTQRELASRSHCSIITIKKIEADQRRPSRELADLLGSSLAIPDDKLQHFIECARGQRPVAHLQWESVVEKTAPHIGAKLQVGLPPLPVIFTPIIGRQAELKMLHRFLAESVLITIVGMGGIGKTHLALAFAAEIKRAGKQVAFISLAKSRVEDNLAATILESLGLQLVAGTDTVSQLLAYLANKELLIVLDNFEHLLASAGLLFQMLQAAPRMILLITSRERLRLPGEQLLPLHGLAYPGDGSQGSIVAASADMTQFPAVQLFLNNAQRLMPGFLVDDNDALLDLCQITGGLPLALELAAAWVEILTLPDLVQKLRQNLDLLALEDLHRPARHHSIRAAFDTTWQFLSDGERKAFTQLSVFSGGFTRLAAESIAGITLSTLLNLVSRQLVQLDHTYGRYTLHELLRQYAAEKLAVEPEMEHRVRRQHANFYTDFLAVKDGELKSAKQINALAEIRVDRANIWIAFQWGAIHPDEAQLIDAIEPLGFACQLNNWVEDGYNLFTQSAERLSNNPDRQGVLLLLLHLHVWRGRFATWLGQPLDAWLINVQRLLAEIPPTSELRSVLALYHLAAEEALRDAGEREVARTHVEKALGLYEGLDDSWGQANALAQLGTLCWNVGDYDEAHSYFEESLVFRRQLDDDRGIAYSLDRLGLLLMHRGEMELSCRYLKQAIDLFQQLGDRSGLADAMENLASCWLELGRLKDAHRQYDEAATIYEELGLRHTGYTVLKALTAYVSVHLGDYERALEEAKIAEVLSRTLGHIRSEGLALIAKGMASAAMSNDAFAAVDLASGTDYLREINQFEELAQGIGVQALISYRQGELETAKQYVLSALKIVAEIRGLLSSPDYPLAVWALILADQGEHEQANDVYQLVLAEPLGKSSLWFADIFGRFIPHHPSDDIMPPDERWEVIEQLYQSIH